MTQEVVEQIENTVRDVMNNSLHTAMPGKILQYHDDSGLVDVQPVGSFYCGNVEMEYPVVPGVPLCMMSNLSGIAACIPIKAGDIVLLVFAEQSLSALLTGTSEAQSNERFELTNGIAIPFVLPVASEIQNEANEKNAVIVSNGASKISVTEECIEVSGKCKLSDGLEVSGDIKMSGRISISGNLSVDGSITATGNITGANTEG